MLWNFKRSIGAVLATALMGFAGPSAGAAAAPAASPLAPAGQAQQEVDVALVLAIDASGSIDYQEAELQRKGIAEAFLSKEVLQAIQSGSLGRIGVAAIYFSSRQYGSHERAGQLDDRTRPEKRGRFRQDTDRGAPPIGPRDLDLRRPRAFAAHARKRPLSFRKDGHRRFRRRRKQCRPPGVGGARRGARQEHHHQRAAHHRQQHLAGPGQIFRGLRHRRPRLFRDCRPRDSEISRARCGAS